jgi:hypothetical protein
MEITSTGLELTHTFNFEAEDNDQTSVSQNNIILNTDINILIYASSKDRPTKCIL